MSDNAIDLTIFDAEDVEDFPIEPAEHKPKTESEAKAKIRSLLGADKEDNADKESRQRQRAAKTPRKNKGAFVKPLTEFYGTVGATVAMMEGLKHDGESPCGVAILQSAEKCAISLDELAYQNDAVRRALSSLLQTSAMGAVLVAHAPIIMTVLMHHAPKMTGTFPAGMMSGMPDMPEPKGTDD